MTTTKRLTDMSAFEDALKVEKFEHWYPGHPRYRLSGMDEPQPGDIAYCGFVKDSPALPVEGVFPLCQECDRIKWAVEGA